MRLPADPLTVRRQVHNRANYIWTVDTLGAVGSDGFQFMPSGIWGTSPNDLYLVGHTDNLKGELRHFDGRTWTALKVATAEGGPLDGGFTLEAIWGTSSTNIWIVGELYRKSLIVHYDGVHLTKATIPLKGALHTVWGSSANDIWAGGGNESDGTLFHYNGTIWKSIGVDTNKLVNNIAGFGPNDVYLTAARRVDPNVEGDYHAYFSHWNGYQWTELDSFIFSDHTWKFGLFLWPGENHKLYTSEMGVFSLRSDTT